MSFREPCRDWGFPIWLYSGTLFRYDQLSLITFIAPGKKDHVFMEPCWRLSSLSRANVFINALFDYRSPFPHNMGIAIAWCWKSSLVYHVAKQHHLKIVTISDKMIDFRCFIKVKASLFMSSKNIWISFLPAPEPVVVVQLRLAAADLNFDLTHFASLPPFCKQTRRLLRAADARVFCDFLLWFRYL